MFTSLKLTCNPTLIFLVSAPSGKEAWTNGTLRLHRVPPSGPIWCVSCLIRDTTAKYCGKSLVIMRQILFLSSSLGLSSSTGNEKKSNKWNGGKKGKKRPHGVNFKIFSYFTDYKHKRSPSVSHSVITKMCTYRLTDTYRHFQIKSQNDLKILKYLPMYVRCTRSSLW